MAGPFAPCVVDAPVAHAVNGTAIFRLREHTERLFNSVKILRLKIPMSWSR